MRCAVFSYKVSTTGSTLKDLTFAALAKTTSLVIPLVRASAPHMVSVAHPDGIIPCFASGSFAE